MLEELIKSENNTRNYKYPIANKFTSSSSSKNRLNEKHKLHHQNLHQLHNQCNNQHNDDQHHHNDQVFPQHQIFPQHEKDKHQHEYQDEVLFHVDDIAHPETARWALCGMKNLTHPHCKDSFAGQQLIDCGILPILMQTLNVEKKEMTTMGTTRTRTTSHQEINTSGIHNIETE
jgi:hypothetical protein